MKIKNVCQQTGLTDRAIRYYIEEGLLYPAFTENYIGRKSFDFSDADVKTLGEIAVLRKFGFTVAEIRQIYLHPETIGRVIAAVKARKEQSLLEDQELLHALIPSELAPPDSVATLVSILSKPVQHAIIPADEIGIRLRIFRLLRSFGLFIAAWMPIILCVSVLILDFHYYYYPAFRMRSCILTLLSLFPSFLMFFLPYVPVSNKRKHMAKKWIIVCCIVSIVVSPLLSFGIVSHSETTDFRHYRKLDPDCPANKSALYQELFPAWPHYFENVKNGDTFETVYLDAHYLYRMLPALDYTYDIYAEWPLERESFDKEIARAKTVFESYGPFTTLKKGKYTCYILYDGDEPFKPVTDSYTYCIFAYNEDTLHVRYLYCDSLENGTDQPHYLILDWE